MRRILELDALRGVSAMAIVLARIGLLVVLSFVLSGDFNTRRVRRHE